MRIVGGDTIEVFRTPGRDRYGDKVSEASVGTIEHCVFQWASAASVGLRFHKTDNFQETSTLSAVIFCPRDAAVKLQARDRFKFLGNTFQCVGDRAWDELNPATGHDFGYYMMQCEVVS